ncbi:MAG: hypothetical protein PVG98_10750 [Chromatiales bacterium]
MHAAFIRQVVESAQASEHRERLDELLHSAEQSGWTALVGAIRRILAGRRDTGVLGGLDEEDQVIAEAIMRGLQDPASLPDPEARADPAMAASGLAGLIQAAASGNVEALKVVSDMAGQMNRAGGQMARLAAVIRPLINGERDPDRLCKGMDGATERLVVGILDELGRLARH